MCTRTPEAASRTIFSLSRGHRISRAKGPIIERKQAAPITRLTAFNAVKFSSAGPRSGQLFPSFLLPSRGSFMRETGLEDPSRKSTNARTRQALVPKSVRTWSGNNSARVST